MCVEQCKLLFPEEGLVYDYVLDDAGICSQGKDDLEEEESLKREVLLMQSYQYLGNRFIICGKMRTQAHANLDQYIDVLQ